MQTHNGPAEVAIGAGIWVGLAAGGTAAGGASPNPGGFFQDVSRVTLL